MEEALCRQVFVLGKVQQGWPRTAREILNCREGTNLPSFVQAAVRGVRRANRPRESAESLMIAFYHVCVARECVWRKLERCAKFQGRACFLRLGGCQICKFRRGIGETLAALAA